MLDDRQTGPNFFAVAYPALYQRITEARQRRPNTPTDPHQSDLDTGNPEELPPLLVRCPGAPLPVVDPHADLPLAFGKIVAISGPIRSVGKVLLPNSFQPCVKKSRPVDLSIPPKPVGSSQNQQQPTIIFPSTRPFQKNSSVTLLDGRRGFVKNTYTLPSDGQVIYYVYVVCSDDTPIAADLMLTCFDGDLDPPDISWLPLSPQQKWWIIRLSEIPSEMRKVLDYWPTPASGWPPGSVVSVPLGNFGRQCAKLVEHQSDGVSIVEFPILPTNHDGYGILGGVSTENLLGPSVYWSISMYSWAQRLPASDDASRKHSRSEDGNPDELPPPKLPCVDPAKFLRDDIDC